MDPNLQIVDSSEQNDQNPEAIFTSDAPFATISLSSSVLLLPTCFNAQSRFTALLASPLINSSVKIKLPSQLSTLTTRSILSFTSFASSSPSKSFKSSYYNSTISANPLQNPLSLGPRRPLDPNNGAAIRRASICWFRNDLRVNDNECLNSANNDSMSVLNVYCFDPKDFGRSSGSSSHRASFLIEAVADLRKSLQARGSELVVRIGKPETVLAEMAKEVGAEAVYAHLEVSHDEVKREEKIEAAMKEEGLEMKYFWGSTLHHVEDLPFKVEDMPTSFGGFKDKAKGLEVRKAIAALEQLKGKPARGDVEAGEIPTLVDLGLSQDGKSGVNPSMAGGESEAIHKIQTFAAECKAQTHKGTKDGKDTIYGANFSCKISPWLTNGCISPRTIFEELKKTATTSITAAFNNNDGNDGSSGAGTNWLMHELMWRDFFRFITKKYSSATKLAPAPVTA